MRSGAGFPPVAAASGSAEGAGAPARGGGDGAALGSAGAGAGAGAASDADGGAAAGAESGGGGLFEAAVRPPAPAARADRPTPAANRIWTASRRLLKIHPRRDSEPFSVTSQLLYAARSQH